MQPIKKAAETAAQDFVNCHGGEGTLVCRSLLDGYGGRRFAFMHADMLAPGVSIGAHTHTADEEIYYLVSGSGVLTYDGATYPMEAGDISVCLPGHSHGFSAKEECCLIVVGSR